MFPGESDPDHPGSPGSATIGELIKKYSPGGGGDGVYVGTMVTNADEVVIFPFFFFCSGFMECFFQFCRVLVRF